MIFTTIVSAALPVLLTDQQYFFLSTTANTDTSVIDSEAYKCVNDIAFITAPMQRQCFIERMRIVLNYGPGLLRFQRAFRLKKESGFTDAQINDEINSIFVERAEPPVRVEFASGLELTKRVQKQHLNTVIGDTSLVSRSSTSQRAACIATCPGYINQ